MKAADFIKKRVFWTNLVRDLEYRTPPRTRPLPVERIPAWAAVSFHVRVNLIILHAGILACLKKYDKVRWAESCHDIFKAAERSGGKFEISGLEHVAGNDGPVVFIANHMSTLETFVLGGLIPPFCDITFVIKRDLLIYPIFGSIMRAIKAIAIKRKNPKEDLKQVLDQGMERLKSGCSVVIFPQSTRSVIFDTGTFNSLGIKLAAKAGVCVVPLALKTDFVGNGRLIKDLGPIDPRKTIHMEFGAPLRVERPGKRQHEDVTQFIADRIEKWGGTVIRRRITGS